MRACTGVMGLGGRILGQIRQLNLRAWMTGYDTTGRLWPAFCPEPKFKRRPHIVPSPRSRTSVNADQVLFLVSPSGRRRILSPAKLAKAFGPAEIWRSASNVRPVLRAARHG